MARLQVDVTHHQYVITDTDAEEPDDSDDAFRTGNGLLRVNAESTQASVRTGTAWGTVSVGVDVRDTPPPPAEAGAGEWDEIVEVSMHFTGDGPLIGSLITEELDILPGYPDGASGQWWRVRFHARGRDTAAAGDPTDVSEEHHIQLWPSAQADEIRHKLTDRTGTRSRTPREDPPA
ncbi:hypothetical protein [Streptomyces uncialis]|uniref:hypothetical protein n=1 Tax=Streptomyces uncialis TaxID=1048205 RepID=UPI002F90BE68|nr:hypothetical protein OG268_36915 [Streptomyces uncialis]